MARRLVTILAAACLGVFAVAAAGCGGDDNAASTASETTTATTTETTTPASTESTETTDTSTETTDTSAAPTFATAENCKEFAAFGQKISEAFTGTGTTNLQDAADSIQQLADSAPDEIKADFQTLADGYQKIADALEGVDLSGGQTPDPAALQKLSELGTELSTSLTTASQNIANWAQTNCT